jgi:hypothetical protein
MLGRLTLDPRHDRVSLQLAPLVAREYAGKPLPVYRYNPKCLVSDAPPDMVVIDGPPEPLGGREGMLYQVMEIARPGTLVLLDDANRTAEQAALRAWRDNLGNAVEIASHGGFAKGLASVLVNEPVRRDRLWNHRLDLSVPEVMAAVPDHETFILIDDNQWDLGDRLAGRRALRMLERDGQYWGPPADACQAIAELERLRRQGATRIVFGWPGHWWLDAFAELSRHLHREYRRILANNRLIVFDLTSEPAN